MQVVCMFMKKISIYLKINNISVMIDIKEELNKLLSELNNSENARTDKAILAKAVQLGMNYQEEKIKMGINIVFNELHKK